MLFIEYKIENVKQRVFPLIWWLLTVWDCQSKANVIFSQEITNIFCCYGNLYGGLVFVCFEGVSETSVTKPTFLSEKKGGIVKMVYQNQVILNNNECHCTNGNEETIR